VPWRSTVRIAKLAGEDGIVPFPACDAIETVCPSGSAPERLVVVAHRKEHVSRPLDARGRETAEHVAPVAVNPAMEVFGGKRRHCGIS
jgi:hypothetical protein